MSNIVLLSDNEQEKFDKPPALPAEFRTTCFAITKELEIQIKRLYSKTNKVGFLLQYGFFKACKKFFTITQFNKSDLKYAANLLNIDMHEVDIKQYKNKIPTNHQDPVAGYV